jgi:hypothetical protein
MCAVVLLVVTVQVDAQPSADELKRNVQDRAQKIAEYRALLEDPDQAVRLSALDVMLKSDDTAMQALAYEAAFKSSDATMRAVALKNRIAGLSAIVVKVKLRDTPSEDEKKVNTKWGGTYAFDIKSFDEKTGTFKTSGHYKSGNGHVSGATVQFHQQYCDGSFQLTDGAVLQGSLGCRSRWEGQYKGSIDLY